MKRLLIVFLSALFLLSMFGCSLKSGDSVNNKVFTDEFFEDVVEIRFGIIDEPITGDQLAAVTRYLKSLYLTHSEKEIPEEKTPGTYGGSPIVHIEFVKQDGTSLMIRLNEWAMSGLPGGSYVVTNYVEAIERGDKDLLCSIWEACGRDPDDLFLC